jgi:hypothetical protein
MSRAQTVRLTLELGGLALGLALFLSLLAPFHPIPAFLVGAVAWLVVGSVGERYFRRNASLDEIRADLEHRKNTP